MIFARVIRRMVIRRPRRVEAQPRRSALKEGAAAS
jgi:hypothetical protein